MLKELPRFLKITLALIAFVLIASGVSRQLAGDGYDFQAYYKAAGRWLAGTSPYVYEKAFAYKYAPVVVLPFTFFHAFSYDVARWVYTLLHIALALTLPFALHHYLRQDSRLNLKVHSRRYATGLVVSFVATLRFVDGEFQVSQIGLWIIGGPLGGLLLLQRAYHSAFYRALGLALMSLASLVKVHTALAFLSFAKWRSWKTWAWVAGVYLLVALLPDPRMWLDWARQMRETTYDLPIRGDANNLQGFYPVAVLRFGMNQFGFAPLLLALPMAIFAFVATGRHSLEDLRTHPSSLLLSLSSWILLGFMASPLPWQYTYSILWVLIPLSWVCATTLERKVILAVSLFLGLSTQALIGKSNSQWIENHHSVFAALLIFWTVLTLQAARWRPRS